MERIWERVTSRTRVPSLSHITSPTAVELPVGELVGSAREWGILTVVGGAHAPSQSPLDLGSLGADFYAGNCHKWMMAPKGAGFLYARREREPLLHVSVQGYNTSQDLAALVRALGREIPIACSRWRQIRWSGAAVPAFPPGGASAAC